MRKDGSWRFDTAAGREEILFRRIGRNELSAIQACLAYADAQQEYAEKGVAGNGVYAQRIVSQPGKKDGLYYIPTGIGTVPVAAAAPACPVPPAMYPTKTTRRLRGAFQTDESLDDR